MFCPKCGTKVSDDKSFCPECGAPLKAQAQSPQSTQTVGGTQPTGAQGTPKTQPRVQFQSDTVILPDEYRPISMWGYFGYEILFAIPVVGFIVLIVMSISAKNQNVKNFARSYFCFSIIMIILLIVFAVAVFGGAAGAASNGVYY